MPSPLPGMNPYLESPELWSEFHSRMIVAIADALDTTLSQDYRVAVEKRIYLTQGEETFLIGIPDVSVTAPPQANTGTTATAIATELMAEPMTIEIPLAEEVQERYLEIREISPGRKSQPSGRVKVNSVPDPGLDCTAIVPWCFSMICCTIASPRPVPFPAGFVVNR
jgi:Protein of unknown function (DUF4058)